MVSTNCLDRLNSSSKLNLSCSEGHFRREKLIKTTKLLLEQLMIAYNVIRGSDRSCILIYGDVEVTSN